MWRKRLWQQLLSLALAVAVLAGCSTKPRAEVVEVTRIATRVETVTSEGEVVEVTRVVVETIVETLTVEGGGDLPSSTGSEKDAAPFPTPAAGLKVALTRLDAGEDLTAVFTDEPRADGVASLNLTLADSSRLVAGEIDDNKEWAAYLGYLRFYTPKGIIPISVQKRHIIRVTDAIGQPVVGASILIEVGGRMVTRLRTHSDGTAYFFPDAYSLRARQYVISIPFNGVLEALPIVVDSSEMEWPIKSSGVQTVTAVPLDILFLLDATGSMDDEIRQLKDNIAAISAQINASPARADVRFALVTYRDRGEADVTHLFDFTPDLEAFVTALAAVEAVGGGDYAEDLHSGLSQAIHEASWRAENSISLIFLLADAPPHLDYGQEHHYAYEVRQAATAGIKIYPIASSGLNVQGEYIFRQLAQVTGGRFIFLNQEDADSTTSVDTPFIVTYRSTATLDTVILRIIDAELQPLAP